MRVISASEMQRIEGLAFSELGESLAEQYMEEAGLQVALRVQNFLREQGVKTLRGFQVYLLCGRGNNAGDAYVCGRHLVACGMNVHAYQIPPLAGSSPLCLQKAAAFIHRGGSQELVGSDNVVFLARGRGAVEPPALLIDGLLGTGLRGQPTELYAQLIAAANAAGLPILAIDIPSGLSGDRGLEGRGLDSGAVINARQTLFLGLPKLGFFLGAAWERVGELVPVAFGLPASFFAKAQQAAVWLELRDVAPLLPPLKRCRHKYQAGAVMAWAGSQGLRGAALLACHASLRAGAGLVRLLHTDDWQPGQGQGLWELMTRSVAAESLWAQQPRALEDWLNLLSAGSGCLMGPGIGLGSEVGAVLRAVVPLLQKPLVLDADALTHFAHEPFALPAQVIFTPHSGEMQRLLGLKQWQASPENLELCRGFSQCYQLTLVLKGAPTFIFHPGQTPVIIGRGDPGMATAGSGDVLTGILAALLSQGLDAFAAAKIGVLLHALAGEAAAASLGSESLLASDMIAHLPDAFYQLRACAGERVPPVSSQSGCF